MNELHFKKKCVEEKMENTSIDTTWMCSLPTLMYKFIHQIPSTINGSTSKNLLKYYMTLIE